MIQSYETEIDVSSFLLCVLDQKIHLLGASYDEAYGKNHRHCKALFAFLLLL